MQQNQEWRPAMYRNLKLGTRIALGFGVFAILLAACTGAQPSTTGVGSMLETSASMMA